MNAEIALDLTHEELVAVTELFDAALPATGVEIPDLPEEERVASMRAARRSLVARGIVSIDADGSADVTVLSPYDVLFAVLLMPTLVVTAGRFTREGSELRSYRCRPELTVEHFVTRHFFHRLVPLTTDELFSRVTDFTGLESGRQPPAERRGFSAKRVAMEALELVIRTGQGPDPTSLFPSEAASFLAAVRTGTHVTSGSIQCFHVSDSGIAGGELAWIDSGDGGLWAVSPTTDVDDPRSPADEDSAVISITPSSPAELGAELLSYLPGVAHATSTVG